MKQYIYHILTIIIATLLVTQSAWGATLSSNGGDISASATYDITGNITPTNVWIIKKGATVIVNLNGKTLNGNGARRLFHIESGASLTINGPGTLTNCSSANGGAIYVYDGGTLTLNECTITGNKATTNGGAIYAAGTGSKLIINEGTQITNNTATSAGGGIWCTNIDINGTSSKKVIISGNRVASDFNWDTGSVRSGTGGGIFVNVNKDISLVETLTCDIEYCTIKNNFAAASGGGIYSGVKTTIKNSTIESNRAMTTESPDNPKSPNKGRGGGFYFEGVNQTEIKISPEFILDNTTVTDNACMWYGGGGQICTLGELTLQNNSKIDNNTCVLKGAGGLHITGTATLNMYDNTSISNNKSFGGVGGGIHSSYTCTINLNGGTISGNEVWGRGGGVHVNTGGELVLNGTNITGNKAYESTDQIYSTVNESVTPVTWSVPQPRDGDTDTKNTGLGGGILIDSGSCRMNSGELSSNYADLGGGAIGLVMINMANKDYFDDIKVAEFILNEGQVSRNKAGNNEKVGNGAAIYLMKSKAREAWDQIAQSDQNTIINNMTQAGVNAILNGIPTITINGGSITGNTATGNGGGTYQQEKTAFIVSAEKTADLSENTAGLSGGAVYIEKGTFTVNGIANIKKNVASAGDGGAIYLGEGTESIPSAFIVTDQGTLNLGGVNEDDGNIAGNDGGGVYCGGTFSINGSALVQNNKARNGAGVYVLGADANFNAYTQLLNNRSTANGGAVYVDGGQFSGSSSIKMNSNSAGGNGGAVYVEGGSISINENVISANTAANGGAIYVNGGGFTANGGTEIKSNTATGNGGAVYVTGTSTTKGNININGNSSNSATITGNYSTGEGGAFYVNNGDITMGLTELSGNGKDASSVVHTSNGGAIALKNGTFSFADGSEIKDNHAKGNGGGLYISNESATSIRCIGGSYINNTAVSGGGLYASGPITLQFAANMQGNKAVNGGGMYLAEGINMTFGVNEQDLKLSGLIVGNEAKGEGENGVGGGVYLAKGTLQFALSDDFKDLGIYNNSASYEAADIYSSGSQTIVHLPNVSGMNLTGFDVPGSDLYWVRDFSEQRYETLLRNNQDIADLIVHFDGAPTLVLESEQCLDLGYDLVFVTLIPVGLDAFDNAAVTISYPHKTTGDPAQYRKVVLHGTEPQIVGLPSNHWHFVATPWSFTYQSPEYDPPHATETSGTDRIDYILIKRNHNQEIKISFSQNAAQKEYVTHDVLVVNPMRPGGSNN